MRKKLAMFLAVSLSVTLLATACAPSNNSGGSTTTKGETTAATGATNATGAETTAGGNLAANQDLVVNVGGSPDTIDPVLNTALDAGTMILHAFEGLYTLDKEGIPAPAQAKEVKISDDSLTYTFTLRDDLKWNDGQPLTAKDFVYAWNRAINPDTASDYEYLFANIEGYDEGKLNITAKDDKTLEVKLKAITPYFLELCAFPAFAPVRQDIIEANPENWTLDPQTYIGNGPYKLTEITTGSHATYVKNENYWNYDALGPDSIKFVFIEDDVALLNAFENGEILLADSMPQDEIDAWSDRPEFNLVPQLGNYYISFNVEKAPLDNVKVREALSLAIDRQYLIDNISKMKETPAGAFVPVGMFDANPPEQFRDVGGDFFDPTAEAYEANLAKAKELLAEAGYPNGEGLPTIEYFYNENTKHQQIGEALQNMWKELGVNVELVQQEWATFLNTRKNGDYQIARDGWIADFNDPISFLDMYISTSGNNNSQWKNAEYDALIEKVKASSDQEERMKLMHEAEAMLFKDAILSPLFYQVDLFLLSPKLQGAYTNALGFRYFMYSSILE